MTTENILLGYAKLWIAPVGEADPNETSIGYGVNWGGNWNYMGDTLEPLTVATEREKFELEIEQSTTPVKESITKQTVTLKTVLAEHTIENMKRVFGGDITTVAAGASQVGYDLLQFGGDTDPDVYKVGFEALYKDASNNQLPVRYIFHRGSITLDGDINFGKGEATGIPVAITSLNDTTQTAGQQVGSIYIVTAPATS